MNKPPRPIASYYAGDPQPDSTLSESQAESDRWTLAAILEEFREAARSNRDMGDRFERLMVAYLKLDPKYNFSDVWMWMDWPDRSNEPDTGVDIVAREEITGDYWAIQCKFYHPEHTLSKRDIDSFFTTSGKAPFKHRLIISTTDNWSENAKKALEGQQIPTQRLRVEDLADAPIDWSDFRPDALYSSDGSYSSEGGDRPCTVGDQGSGYQVSFVGLKRRAKKELRPHQQEALAKTIAGLRESDRGKLIMACGTGKTFTSLKIAETWVNSGLVLFLVPSIALLSQTLREWTAEAAVPLHCVAVCSDPKVNKRSRQSEENEDLHTYDLPVPVTTDAVEICQKVQIYLTPDSSDNTVGARSPRPSRPSHPLTVIFSTYQSLEAVAEAQKQGLPAFDLIICDEAHRTTGVTAQGSADSHFVLVHDAQKVRGKRRLYMTATPRIYKESAKTKARENEAEVFSMDDPDTYGLEFHRLGFAEAVSRDLLSDYKVMVLAVDEKFVSRSFQRQLADEDNALTLEDAVKITGCWNGLAKRMARTIDSEGFEGDTTPMRRAVAFCGRIDHSKTIRDLFNEMVREYAETHPTTRLLRCEVDHVDGTQNVLERNRKLDWLKADTRGLDSDRGSVCRILSNARCLSEGVDVPALDAVMFLSPRNSIVDVVQSVGRVMRKAPGKKYGYIILPIGIPADMTPEEALKDNKKYEVVWQVLQALRAHDDRFNAEVNQIELNERKPKQIEVIGVRGEPGEDNLGADQKPSTVTTTQLELNFPELEEWRDAIFAKIVQKCGDRRYWENWAKDVATIAESHITRIEVLLEKSEHRQAFEAFLTGLQQNLNPTVTAADAIEMLSQHLITKPVFDALFEQYPFTQLNPVSVAMQQMLDLLEGEALEKDTQQLDRFYASVEKRAAGIDNAAGKQKIILELYDKFFKTAFPRMSERLGIVYTPVEVVDFILHSADYALRQEFNVGLTDAGVHILDPFTGTGTFLVRLLQSGLIQQQDLQRKFREELHANEIVLLAYYIAAINIEEAYHGLVKSLLFPSEEGVGVGLASDEKQTHPPAPSLEGEKDVRATYEPFQGIVLTDTFQMFENSEGFLDRMFPENNQRVARQKANPIQVIIGNPPYSAGQTSENDGNKNLKYPQLDDRIRTTYAEHSSATNKNSLYDSYIRGIRWASDRIQERGIVAFVTNGSFIDSNSADGLRKCLEDEFTKIYVFNLRGNGRTSGETCRKEGHPLFAATGGKGGSLAPIAITILIKNPENTGGFELLYHDIGDYLTRQQKLETIANFGSISSINWQKITPNTSHDWINQRDPAFDSFISLGDKQDPTAQTIFDLYSRGIATSRDAWCYNFAQQSMINNMDRMIYFYNSEVDRYQAITGQKPEIEQFTNNDPTQISWSRGLKNDLGKLKKYSFAPESVFLGIYRPYCKQWVYFNRSLNDMVYQMPKIFPIAPVENIVISITAVGSQKEFSALIANVVPDLHFLQTGNHFPLYTYEKQSELGALFASDPNSNGYTRKDNIPDSILHHFRNHYQTPQISKEDIFYYVYGILHSPEYKTRFAADLKKMLPRIPLSPHFAAFSTAGRNLAHWHLNYETIEPYPLEEVHTQLLLDDRAYQVQKMQFPKVRHNGKLVPDKTSILYNNKITLTGIPLEAYDYKVCDRSAIEWIMERYQISRDKNSGILNDPNTYNPENPRYILDLLKRIVRVSLETLKIVNELPPLEER